MLQQAESGQITPLNRRMATALQRSNNLQQSPPPRSKPQRIPHRRPVGPKRQGCHDVGTGPDTIVPKMPLGPEATLHHARNRCPGPLMRSRPEISRRPPRGSLPAGLLRWRWGVGGEEEWGRWRLGFRPSRPDEKGRNESTNKVT